MVKKPTYEALEQRVLELEKADFERMQIEKALRESEQIFNCFMENSPIYVFFKDKDIRPIKLSKNYEQMLGKPLTEILGKTMDELFPSDLAKSMIADDLKVLNEGKVVVVDEQLHGRYYTTIKFPIFVDGQPTYLSGYTLDITDRMEAVEALRKSEAELRDRNRFIQTILDNLPIGLAVNNLDRGTATYLNEKFEEIYGWPAEELKDVATFFEKVYPDPEYRKEIQSRVLRDIESGDPERMQWENIVITTQEGSKKYIFAKNIPLFEQNMMISTVQDVTTRKRSEEEREKLQQQLIHAQKMESVGRLAGGVAHDYNNMLGAILGHTELALDKVAPDHPVVDHLKEIYQAAQRSVAITKQLLAFARKQTIAPQVLDLNETVEGMLKMFRRLIGENIDLAWRPKAGLWPVKMDVSQIDQILANLCVNARDAIADVGKITIETGKMVFDEAYCKDHVGFSAGEYVLLAVSDNGCGMTPETLAKIFEPFFTTKEVGRGTGLGLATIYGIVKQNKGFVNVYSEPGLGTTFKIYLPRHYGAVQEADRLGEMAIPGSHGEIVLLVEDDAAILNIGKILLENLGYRVLAAGSPNQAIHLAEQHAGELQLLITDVIMPEMNGRELAERLRCRFPAIKTLFMSGYTANVIAHHGVLEEGVNFIQKPFSKHHLAFKVHETLHKNET